MNEKHVMVDGAHKAILIDGKVLEIKVHGLKYDGEPGHNRFLQDVDELGCAECRALSAKIDREITS